MYTLQFITHRNELTSYMQSAELALKGGCRWIQLRMKDATPHEWQYTGRRVRDLCNDYNAIMILDDRVDLVDELQADGVHLGRNDMPIPEARGLLGPDKLIGGTANTIDDIRRLAAQKADYIGCGPFRFTTTKQNLSPLIGLEGYRSIMQACQEEHIHIPIFAIGGIVEADLPDLLHTGIHGVAVSSCIINAPQPVLEMRHFISTIASITNK